MGGFLRHSAYIIVIRPGDRAFLTVLPHSIDLPKHLVNPCLNSPIVHPEPIPAFPPVAELARNHPSGKVINVHTRAATNVTAIKYLISPRLNLVVPAPQSSLARIAVAVLAGNHRTSKRIDAVGHHRRIASAIAVDPLKPTVPRKLVVGPEVALTPHAADLWWMRRREKIGMPGWTLHQFRHQFATNLAASNVHPKVMQKLLGHTTPVLSLQVYTHVHADQGTEAINLMDGLKHASPALKVAV